MRAYLDIETAFDGSITVIGIYRPDRGTIQLVGGGIHDISLYDALDGIETIVTFNGTCFDVPVIKKRMYVDLLADFAHCDLMYVARKQGLKGGLKRLEVQIGIARETAGLTGYDAPRLWQLYETTDDRAALEQLLRYNREDIVNLAALEAHLGLSAPATPHDAVVHRFA